MCGIVGYLGQQRASEILLEGLRKLEYRGYDSAGIALRGDRGLEIFRCKGKIRDLEQSIRKPMPTATCGIGHTRWATHGRPSEENAHPHRVGDTVVVHNGIIENHLALRKELEDAGAKFQSETDTEIFAHLIQRAIEAQKGKPDLLAAVRSILPRIQGSYALGVLNGQEPERLVFARKGSPLILGLGNGENFAASDISAILSYTRRMIILEDGDLVELRADAVSVFGSSGAKVNRPVRNITWDPLMAEKGGYPHFMLKEIHDQPRSISDTLAGRLSLEMGRVFFDGKFPADDYFRVINRIVVVACGTSYHAGLTSCYEFERVLRIPANAEFASEIRYRDPVLDERTMVIAISQSGETADTLAAVELAKQKGAKVLAVCNVLESSIARAADYVVYTHAGPEISVASTKAFVTQLVTLQMVLVHTALARKAIDHDEARRWLTELSHLPTVAAQVLESESAIKTIARRFAYASDMLYLGRDVHFPLAMEGALKLKEISYIHAEAYPAGEMKHGPIALVDKDVPVFFIVHGSSVREKVIANMEEIRARDGRVIALTLPDDAEVAKVADTVIPVPSISARVDPVLLSIPLQLFAYHVAVHRGTDVDQPRNLAKSVTVE